MFLLTVNCELNPENLTHLRDGLFSAVFCIYYIVRGVLQENRQELVVFVLSIVVLMIRSVVNFSVLGPKGKEELLVGLPLLVDLR